MISYSVKDSTMLVVLNNVWWILNADTVTDCFSVQKILAGLQAVFQNFCEFAGSHCKENHRCSLLKIEFTIKMTILSMEKS